MSHTPKEPAARIWRVRVRKHDSEWTGPLVAYWEVHLDPMSDDYTPDDIDAIGLLQRWVTAVRADCPNELVPIYWYVDSPGQGKFERMPFQFPHGQMDSGPREDFLAHYTWPVDARTGEPLNWVTLPVIDKHWNASRADKGGFIQEATTWKPAILQPFVHLPTLVATRS